MKKLTLLLPVFLVLSCQQRTLPELLQSQVWVDLTHDFDTSTVYWPTNEPFSHDTVFYGMTDGGYFYSSFNYRAEEHGGTHFDAPIHFAQGGKTVEQISLQQLHGPGVVVNVTKQAAENRDYLVTIKDLEDWETRHGEIPDGAIVLLYTGFGNFWNDHLRYTGTLESGKEGVAELNFPGLDPEASKWLVENRKINAIGLDTPSIDYGKSTEFKTHRILFAAGITAYENLANLDQLPESGSYVIALPMKIKGGSGAPLRIVAVVE